MQPDHCDRGLAELDKSKWNYRHKLCRRPRQGDSQGAPCEYLDKRAPPYCVHRTNAAAISIAGVFSSRAMGMWKSATPSVSPARRSRRCRYLNYNILLGNLNRAEREPLRSHNLEINSLERFLTLVNWVELDLVEYIPRYGPSVIGHEYRNWLHVHHPDVPPLRTNKRREFCQSMSHLEGGYSATDPPDCSNGAARITITEGMEWTPEGYLFLRRVHGLDDTPTIPAENGTDHTGRNVGQQSAGSIGWERPPDSWQGPNGPSILSSWTPTIPDVLPGNAGDRPCAKRGLHRGLGLQQGADESGGDDHRLHPGLSAPQPLCGHGAALPVSGGK